MPMEDRLEQQGLSMSQSSLKSSPAASSPSTTVTTPEQSPGADDDIWDTSPDYPGHGHNLPQLDLHNIPSHQSEGGTGGVGHDEIPGTGLTAATTESTARPSRGGEILSDIPSLRRQHMTDGYREGLAVGKARIMQAGFDAGYPFGVEIGLRVGQVLGVLEGIVSAATSSTRTNTPADTGHGTTGGGKGGVALPSSSSSGLTVSVSSAGSGSATNSPGLVAGGRADRDSRSTGKVDDDVVDVQFVRRLYDRAKTELKISELLKGLDDTKIAELPGISHVQQPQHQQQSSGEQDDASMPAPVSESPSREITANARQENAKIASQEGECGENSFAAPSLPEEIEVVLAKWETIVLGSLS